MDYEEILKGSGWEVECESPLEIRHTDGSFATMQAAMIVLERIEMVRVHNEGDDVVING